jgi:hypothetical protein
MAELEELVDYFLSKEIMTSENSISKENNAKDLTTVTAESKIEAHIMSNGYRYLPILSLTERTSDTWTGLLHKTITNVLTVSIQNLD